MLIEILGIDGSGKTTMARRLAVWLGGEYRKVDAFRDGAYATALSVERNLGSHAATVYKANAIAKALLQEILDVSTNRPLVFDRFVEGALMYFAVKGIYPIPESVFADLPQPSHVVLLDLPVSLALRRRSRPAESDLEIERNYMLACRDYLCKRAQKLGWSVVDATRPADVVFQQICELTSNFD